MQPIYTKKKIMEYVKKLIYKVKNCPFKGFLMRNSLCKLIPLKYLHTSKEKKLFPALKKASLCLSFGLWNVDYF